MVRLLAKDFAKQLGRGRRIRTALQSVRITQLAMVLNLREGKEFTALVLQARTGESDGHAWPTIKSINRVDKRSRQLVGFGDSHRQQFTIPTAFKRVQHGQGKHVVISAAALEREVKRHKPSDNTSTSRNQTPIRLHWGIAPDGELDDLTAEEGAEFIEGFAFKFLRRFRAEKPFE
jgi:hypothetical protein